MLSPQYSDNKRRARVLITGGTGLFGTMLALNLREKFDVFIGTHKRKSFLTNVTPVTIDLLSVDDVCAKLQSRDIDVVFNAVALTNVELCEKFPARARDANVVTASNISKGAALTDVSLIHISTDHLFNGVKMFVDEVEPLSPLNVYGSTKAEAENVVLEMHPSALVIRTNFFGWGAGRNSSFSDTIINSLRDQKKIDLFDDVFFTPILIESLIEALIELWQGKHSGIFNIVGDQRISKYSFGKMLAAEFMLNSDLIKPVSIKTRSDLVLRPVDMSLSNKKSRDILQCSLKSLTDQIVQMRRSPIQGEAKFFIE